MFNASKHPRPGSNRGYNASQTLEDVSWDKYTFKLPVKLTNAATAPPSVKDRYFRTTLEGIKAANQAPSVTKINVLSSRFSFPHLPHEVDGSLKALYDNTAGMENNIVITEDPQVFTFSRPSLRNEQGQPIPLPNAGANPLTAAVRRDTRFYSFQLTANAGAAYDGPDNIRTAAKFTPQYFNAAIAIPSVLIDDANNADNGREVLPPELTADVLRDIRQTLAVIKMLNADEDPIIGTLSKPSGQFLVSLHPESFQKDFMVYFHLCRLKLFKELLRSEFLGKSLVDASYVVHELQSLRQNRWDPETKRFVANTVEEYYGNFTASQNLLPYNHIYPVDIAMLFWNGLSPDIRQQGESAETPYTPPMRPHDGQVETNQQADARLRSVKDAAVRFERQLDNVKTQVGRAQGRYQSRGPANTFMATPNFMPGQEHDIDNIFNSPDDIQYNMHTVNSFATSDIPSEQHDDPLMTASVYLSVAEEAIQNATGTTGPPIECWGCTDHPVYHNNRFHRWMDCPVRGDSSVAANAKKGLQQFIEKRKANRKGSGTSATNNQWRQRGYPSQAVAQLITSIVDPRTLPSQRQAFIHYLTNLNSNSNSNVNTTAMNNDNIVNSNNEDTTAEDHQFLALPIRILAAIKPPPDLQLSISQVMPHVNIPIGKSNRAATLSCMVDSGAGLSIGRLSYHKSIYQRHPELVHRWIELKDSANMEEFTIGGIDAKGVPTKVTSMISYVTPFTINGQAVNIQFALAEDVASNAIVGLPFLRSTNSSVLFEHDTMVSQKLGYTFKVFYQVPHQSEVAPMTSPGATATFPATIVTPPQVSKEISNSGDLLAKTFAALAIKTKQSPQHASPGLLLCNQDIEDVYTSINDGDEWFLPTDKPSDKL